jgi:glycine/D-amino acid oxidase-like deaminating enzyme
MFDAIVVGGGAVGAATALLLARGVFRCSLLIKRDFPPRHRSGISFSGRVLG